MIASWPFRRSLPQPVRIHDFQRAINTLNRHRGGLNSYRSFLKDTDMTLGCMGIKLAARESDAPFAIPGESIWLSETKASLSSAVSSISSAAIAPIRRMEGR